VRDAVVNGALMYNLSLQSVDVAAWLADGVITAPMRYQRLLAAVSRMRRRLTHERSTDGTPSVVERAVDSARDRVSAGQRLNEPRSG
jgi:hypothetical protein